MTELDITRLRESALTASHSLSEHAPMICHQVIGATPAILDEIERLRADNARLVGLAAKRTEQEWPVGPPIILPAGNFETKLRADALVEKAAAWLAYNAEGYVEWDESYDTNSMLENFRAHMAEEEPAPGLREVWAAQDKSNAEREVLIKKALAWILDECDDMIIERSNAYKNDEPIHEINAEIETSFRDHMYKVAE